MDVYFTVTDKNELDIRYEATTDKPTVLNLSNHSFFNISGDFSHTVENQKLMIDADRYTPYDSTKCVTGEMLPVTATPFDFKSPRYVGDSIDVNCLQLNVTGGYDHTVITSYSIHYTKLYDVANVAG